MHDRLKSLFEFGLALEEEHAASIKFSFTFNGWKYDPLSMDNATNRARTGDENNFY